MTATTNGSSILFPENDPAAYSDNSNSWTSQSQAMKQKPSDPPQQARSPRQVMPDPASIHTQRLKVKKRAPFERIVLLLQGGGALGSYQAGAYQALSEANLQPDWVAGISIGAVNAALIAGNVPEKRIEKLR